MDKIELARKISSLLKAHSCDAYDKKLMIGAADMLAMLIAELEKAQLHIKHIGNDALRAENIRLTAELAALKGQSNG